MGFEVSGIGYNDSENGKNITGEIVDMDDDLEHQLVHEINEATKEFRASIGELCDNCLENLNNLQLAHFLSATYFPGNKAKSYRECISGDATTLEFSIRAALQLLEKRDSDDNKYNANGIIVTDGTGKTIDERLMGENKEQGIKADGHIDETIVKILQAKVGATIDGKPGPQTISKVIYELGLNTEQIYAAVNTYYGSRAGGEKFTVGKIVTYPGDNENKEAILAALGNKFYKFDSSKFSFYYDLTSNKPYILPVGGQPIEVNMDPSKKLTCDNYSFGDDGLIRFSKKNDSVESQPNSLKDKLSSYTGTRNNEYFGLSNDVVLYNRLNGTPGCCYFEGNTLVDIQDLSELSGDNKYTYFKQTTTDGETWQIDSSLVVSENSRSYLEKVLKYHLENKGIPTSGKEIKIDNGNLVLSSFGYNAILPKDILSNGLVFNNNLGDRLGEELKMLNLCNYSLYRYKNDSKFKGGTATFENQCYLKINGNFVIKDTDFAGKYGRLSNDEGEKLCTYINSRLHSEFAADYSA